MIKSINNYLYIFCDGGARGNPGPAAIGFLIKDNKGRVIVKKGKYIGKATNNVAEYKAVIEALEWLCQNKLSIIGCQQSIIHFYLDSQLVVNQLNGRFKIKNSNLQYLIIKAKGLENQIKASIFYHYISREKNQQADKLVNQTLDKLER